MTTRKNATFPIVLKTIINDAHRDNKSFTLNDKQIRSRLRANANVAKFHVKNTSHVANNQTQYDAMRCAFDTQYASKMTRTTKRAKRVAKTTNVETIDA